MRKVIGSVILLGIASVASYAEEKPRIWIMGFGIKSCGEYLEITQRGDDISEMLFLSWAQGFLSKANEETVRQYPYNQVRMDIYAMKHELINLCRVAPTVSFSLAVGELARQASE